MVWWIIIAQMLTGFAIGAIFIWEIGLLAGGIGFIIGTAFISLILLYKLSKTKRFRIAPL